VPAVPEEGVIKFSRRHTPATLPAWAELHDLQHWFVCCRQRGLIGQDPDRYCGAAYGNLSQRASHGFLVTGSQTGGLETLGREHFAWVQEVDANRNLVVSSGPIAPSSESMTHAQLYSLLPEVNFVIHVHHKGIWEHAAELGLAITDPAAPYGTPHMAREVDRLLRQESVRQSCALSMGGHEDGIVTFGHDAQQAGETLLQILESSAKLHGLA